jgi:hypothetical protein
VADLFDTFLTILKIEFLFLLCINMIQSERLGRRLL